MSRYLFSSESVTEGHPDKICDQISDTILDALLTQDPRSRVAAEVVVNTGMVVVTGEITTTANVNFTKLVRDKIREIGYTEADNGFSADSCAVFLALDEQSPEIAQGVSCALEVRTSEEDALDRIGAGDQGLMFGFACTETPELMPLPISVAHRLTRRLAQVRKDGTLAYLKPDGKAQVTVEYERKDGVDRPGRIDTILISTQHAAVIDDLSDNDAVQARIKADLQTHVIGPVFADLDIRPDAQTRLLVNPSGRFVIGGPQGDSGLTGRKIIVDTYGGYARHGGGAFSGKDPTKVDRSAAYAARYVAKNIVAAELADRCEVQVAYAIGVARPVSIFVETFGTGRVSDEALMLLVREHFDLRPAAILRDFDLCRLPAQRGGRFYQDVAAYGHLGRPDLDLPWEHTDKAATLKQAIQTAAAV
ncbi:methionine adenosyltransferase [Gloeobacter violaceus]|uniref:S-adenosylmethionine synthase n=1 Tax=Gloeobacter violaceus (strain ATCC 29082 / PCC 7421) TaxID=251221 RepID=METK_GLOVI|nr:methionine adenosyltransferase [Gloeobacter violaceus]Q7NHG0.1 RecName: Full=S-adenosylmethionine synthase; Short=AdoMet synthase; AltName: Full=MAT; AltName: Full=Methionine adenosyltransferase [Gloeobacter violaceus PCC 7421]BAC90518.1 S-adenosylmethionine synthetase [Gloeobacter violaceus PCC 7421]